MLRTTGKGINDVAHELGIPVSTLSNWDTEAANIERPSSRTRR